MIYHLSRAQNVLLVFFFASSVSYDVWPYFRCGCGNCVLSCVFRSYRSPVDKIKFKRTYYLHNRKGQNPVHLLLSQYFTRVLFVLVFIVDNTVFVLLQASKQFLDVPMFIVNIYILDII